jgi:hypothetical protein
MEYIRSRLTLAAKEALTPYLDIFPQFTFQATGVVDHPAGIIKYHGGPIIIKHRPVGKPLVGGVAVAGRVVLSLFL